MSDDFETRVQKLAEEHLAGCNEALIDDLPESPALGPYDGCDTCVVREILSIVWEEMLDEARREVMRERGETDDWFVPGGAMVDGATTIRLRPPPNWTKLVLEIPRVPPSMNNNVIRSSWRGFHEEKKSWQQEIEMMLMTERVKRFGYERAIVGSFMRFPQRARRDPGNFTSLLNKACGDALVQFSAIPDDTAPHYFFGGVEIEPEPGPERTVLWVYLQPKEEG